MDFTQRFGDCFASSSIAIPTDAIFEHAEATPLYDLWASVFDKFGWSLGEARLATSSRASTSTRRLSFGALGRRHVNPAGFDIAEHGLLQLRVHFVCNGNHVSQHLAEIHSV
jgi:hypothetical protein